ncbi:unnamed protein product [Amoebophrya sp. A120]|nr:unnamed protein product [Amoebophrya sp. A120]|eukprot:GSA120T00024984001.1
MQPRPAPDLLRQEKRRFPAPDRSKLKQQLPFCLNYVSSALLRNEHELPYAVWARKVAAAMEGSVGMHALWTEQDYEKLFKTVDHTLVGLALSSWCLAVKRQWTFTSAKKETSEKPDGATVDSDTSVSSTVVLHTVDSFIVGGKAEDAEEESAVTCSTEASEAGNLCAGEDLERGGSSSCGSTYSTSGNGAASTAVATIVSDEKREPLPTKTGTEDVQEKGTDDQPVPDLFLPNELRDIIISFVGPPDKTSTSVDPRMPSALQAQRLAWKWYAQMHRSAVQKVIGEAASQISTRAQSGAKGSRIQLKRSLNYDEQQALLVVQHTTTPVPQEQQALLAQQCSRKDVFFQDVVHQLLQMGYEAKIEDEDSANPRTRRGERDASPTTGSRNIAKEQNYVLAISWG